MRKQVLFTILAMLVSVSAFSHDIAVQNADGVTIYYNYINDGTELAVTFRGSNYNSYSNEYKGIVVIPEEVTYMNRTRKVTSIRGFAFCGCYGLTSITIGNSVTSIGEGAFSDCSGLTSVTIPNSMASIGSSAFYRCSLTSVIIPNSVTSIGNSAFNGCSLLTSVTIPNSVTSIGDGAFSDCSGLTTVTIPNSVTSIGNGAFCKCSGLTSITIPNSVRSIGSGAFMVCSGLNSISVENGNTNYDSRNNCNAIIETASNTLIAGCKNTTIPNSVTSIGSYAFYGCSGLTSVTIPNSVTSIGNWAFDRADISTVISLIENPFTITGKTSDSRTFSQNTFLNATLYVPKGTIGKYKETEGWKDFVFIEEGTGGGDTPTTQKCATPTISYVDGKLTFDCETEGVEYVSSITPPSAFNSGSKTVSMPTTYKVTVYATKAGYDNSDVATKEINLGGGGAQDVNGDGIVDTQDVLEIYKYIQEH